MGCVASCNPRAVALEGQCCAGSFGGRARRVVPQPRAKGEAGNEKECTPSTSDGPTSTQRAPPRAQACHVGVGIRAVRAGVMVVVVLAVGGFGSWKTRGLPPTVTVTLQISVGWSRSLALDFLTHLPRKKQSEKHSKDAVSIFLSWAGWFVLCSVIISVVSSRYMQNAM